MELIVDGLKTGTPSYRFCLLRSFVVCTFKTTVVPETETVACNVCDLADSQMIMVYRGRVEPEAFVRILPSIGRIVVYFLGIAFTNVINIII